MRAKRRASVPHSAIPSGKSFCNAANADNLSSYFIFDSLIF